MKNKQEDIQFLIDLQNEMKTQISDAQADPRFWVLRQPETIETSEDNAEEYYLLSPDSDYFGPPILYLESILETYDDEMADDKAKVLLEQLIANDCSDQEALDWVLEYYYEYAYLTPVVTINKIIPNTMFITKQDAIDHIKANKHHYNNEVHTYAMTAWRSPKVEKLYDILHNFDFHLLLEYV